MRRKELAYKNLVLGVEFDKYMIEHPKILDKISSRSTMVFLPEYDRELYAANLKLARERMSAGEKNRFHPPQETCLAKITHCSAPNRVR